MFLEYHVLVYKHSPAPSLLITTQGLELGSDPLWSGAPIY